MPKIALSTTSIVAIPAVTFPNIRKRLTLSNADTSILISLEKGRPAVSGEGILLWPRTHATDEPDPRGYMYQGSYSAIAASGTPDLAYTEEIGVIT